MLTNDRLSLVLCQRVLLRFAEMSTSFVLMETGVESGVGKTEYDVPISLALGLYVKSIAMLLLLLPLCFRVTDSCKVGKFISKSVLGISISWETSVFLL